MTDKNDYSFEQLFLDYNDRMYVIAYNILKSKEDSEDAVQSAFEKILSKENELKNLPRWKQRRTALSAVRHIAIDKKRKEESKQELCLEDYEDILRTKIITPYEGNVLDAYESLPEHYKEVFDLKYIHGYETHEIADILGIEKSSVRKRVERTKKILRESLQKGCVLLVCVVFLSLTGIAVNAATDGRFFAAIKEFFGAEVVTEENRDLIGTETWLELETPKKEGIAENNDEPLEEIDSTDSRIVNAVDNGVFIPISITDIETSDHRTPEIMMGISTAAVLYQDDFKGWNCKAGDTLIFEFTKYETEKNDAQKLVVGYVLDGVLYDGERFKELSGCYQLDIKEDGEYYIYLYNMDLNYLTIKSGTISKRTGESEE